jgi:hypothetical protein
VIHPAQAIDIVSAVVRVGYKLLAKANTNDDPLTIVTGVASAAVIGGVTEIVARCSNR